jgi:hypothetical protein
VKNLLPLFSVFFSIFLLGACRSFSPEDQDPNPHPFNIYKVVNGKPQTLSNFDQVKHVYEHGLVSKCSYVYGIDEDKIVDAEPNSPVELNLNDGQVKKIICVLLTLDADAAKQGTFKSDQGLYVAIADNPDFYRVASDAAALKKGEATTIVTPIPLAKNFCLIHELTNSPKTQGKDKLTVRIIAKKLPTCSMSYVTVMDLENSDKTIKQK